MVFLVSFKASKDTRGYRLYRCSTMLCHSGTLSSLDYSTILLPTPKHDINAPLHPTSDDIFPQDSFFDLDLSYGGTSDNPFQWVFQCNGGWPLLRLCIRTYVIKLILQRGQSIPLIAPISDTKKQLAALVFGDDIKIPVEGKYIQEFHKNLQEEALTWAGGLRVKEFTVRT